MAFQVDSQDSINDINITPFVDVVLVLLVIFMVTAPMMVQQSLKVDLPQSKTLDSVEQNTLSVGITANGQYLLNGKPITLASLEIQAREEWQKSNSVQVIFAADLNSRHEAVVKAMDIMRRTGITRFAFQVIKQED